MENNNPIQYKISWFVYLSFLLFTSIWCLLILTAPLLVSMGQKDLGMLNYNLFSPLCHQMPERSLFLFGHKLAVCARCTGIYLGILLSTLLYPKIKGIKNNQIPPIWLLLVAVLPIGFDGLTQYFGLRESTNILRLATGLVFGVILPIYLMPLYIKIVLFVHHHFNKFT